LESLEQRVLFAAGDLDPSFSGDGLAQLADVHAARGAGEVLALPGGKTLVVGFASGGSGWNRTQAYLARYNATGSLDTTFSGDGRMTFDYGNGDDAYATDVLLRTDGKIFVTGHAGDGARTGNTVVGVALLNANGTFDTGFGGGDGRLTVDVTATSSDFVQAAALAPGNKLVVVTGGDEVDRKFRVMRLNANGTPDTTFGGSGFISLNPGPLEDHGVSVAVTSDGGVVVGGLRYLTLSDPQNNRQYETALVKLRTDGTLDMAWGGGDAQVHGTFAQSAFLGLVAAPGGKLVGAANGGVARLNANGTPDTTFSGDGKTDVTAGGAFGDVAVQSDGKVLVARRVPGPSTEDDAFGVTRLTAGGNLDTTWDGDGLAVTNFHNLYETPGGIAIQSDGKVLVAGTANADYAREFESVVVVRYTTGGRPDTTFSSDGKTNNDFGTVRRTAADVVVQPNGMILVGGAQRAGASSSPSGVGEDFFLARYRPDGTPDTTFSGDGRLTTDFAGAFDSLSDLLLLPDGKILALGQSRLPSRNDYDLALARYNADGSLDTTFSGDGKMTLGLGGNDLGVKLARRTDGDIVLSASTGTNVNGPYALVRLNPDGTRDNTLGGSGVLFHHLGAVFALQADNKIILGGFEQTEQYPDGGLYLTRLNDSGVADPSYGSGGRTATVGYGIEDDARAQDIIFQNGKTLVLADVGADAVSGGGSAVGLMRFNPDGGIDTTFGDADRYANSGKGLYLTPERSREIAVNVALDPSGRILVGTAPEPFEPSGAYSRLGALRMLADGAPDTTFGINGRAVVTAGPIAHTARLAVGADGRPVLAGTYFTPDDFSANPPSGIVVARLQGAGASGAGSVELRPDGTLVVRGTDEADRITLTRESDGRTAVNVNGNVTRHAGVLAAELYGVGGDDVILHQLADVRAILNGGDGKDLLEGGDASDRLDGGAGDDVLRGKLGDDVLVNSFGADEFSGGTGTRTGAPDDDVILFGGALSLNISLNNLADDGAGNERDNVLDDIETIYAGDAADTIVAGYYTGRRIFAGHGNDHITGSGESNHIDAGAGDDLIDGGYGADVMIGGPGTDWVSYFGRPVDGEVKVTLDSSTDPNDGTLGDDGVVSERDTIGADVENVFGTDGNDVLLGSEAANLLRGAGGDDVIRGFGGNDLIDGGEGNDLLDGGLGSDDFIGGTGMDLADYSNRTENLTIGIGSAADDGASGEGDNVRTGVENVTAGAGNDTIRGDGVRNVLRGNGGSDSLHGNGGNDFFNGGPGADRIFGGDGDDEIYARDGIADLTLDGGLGTDKAQVDPNDPRTSIEQLIP
jgi:uncharacterized delta-60 repeat protein